MASKTILVAQREYLENVRTKTFWVGILAFPLILLLSFGIGFLLNRAKETKRFAVIDRTGMALAEAVDQEAWSRDQQIALDQIVEKEVADPAALAASLQQAEAELPADHPLRGLLAELRKIPPDELAAELQAARSGDAAGSRRLQQVTFRWLMGQDLKQLGKQMQDLRTVDRFRPVSLEELGVADLPPDEQEKRLNQLLNQDRLFAYFVLDGDVMQTTRDCRYVSNNLTDEDLRQWYGRAATRVVQERRIAAANIDPEVARRIQETVSFQAKSVDETGATRDVRAEEKANKWAPMGFVYLLWIAVFTAAQMLLTNTVEEKSNRIIEVLLSSVSPGQLMSGKIWGIAATGLTIVGSWVVFALLGVWLAPKLIAGMGDFPLMAVIGDPLYLLSFVGYFLGGYLMYAAILVGIGSVCNSLKEAQNLLQPVFILLVVPLVSMMFVTQEPNGTVARVLTYIPLFTPFTMMNRAGGPPPTWEYVASGLLILVTVWLAFRAAGKVFRVGVLMTGKPPKLKEILGWMRQRD